MGEITLVIRTAADLGSVEVKQFKIKWLNDVQQSMDF